MAERTQKQFACRSRRGVCNRTLTWLCSGNRTPSTTAKQSARVAKAESGRKNFSGWAASRVARLGSRAAGAPPAPAGLAAPGELCCTNRKCRRRSARTILVAAQQVQPVSAASGSRGETLRVRGLLLLLCFPASAIVSDPSGRRFESILSSENGDVRDRCFFSLGTGSLLCH